MIVREHIGAPQPMIAAVRDLMASLGKPFKSATEAQIEEYAGRLFELKMLFTAEVEGKAVAKIPAAKRQRAKTRQKIVQEMQALATGAKRFVNFLTRIEPKNALTGSPQYHLLPAVDDALIEAAHGWASKFEAEQNRLDAALAKKNLEARKKGGKRERRDHQLLPPGFASPTPNTDGSIDYGAAGFVRQYFEMSLAMAEIMDTAAAIVKAKPDGGAREEARSRDEVVAVILPRIIKEVFGVDATVSSGSAISGSRDPEEVLASRTGNKIIERSLRLIGVWKPRKGAGEPFKADTLAKGKSRVTRPKKEPATKK
jgi:hypothetical protein